MTGRDSEVGSVKSSTEAQDDLHASSAPGRVEDQSNPGVTDRDFTGVRRVAAAFQPPELWSKPRPPLRSTWLYARYGEQAPAAGAARTFARGYGYVAVGLRFVLLVLDWVVSRPSRLCAALVLWFLLDMSGWMPGLF